MSMQLFSIKDKLNEFYAPHPYPNEDLAKRDFMLAVKSGDDLLSKCPADFALYHVGVFDTKKGVFATFDEPILVVDGASIIKKE